MGFGGVWQRIFAPEEAGYSCDFLLSLPTIFSPFTVRVTPNLLNDVFLQSLASK